MKKLLLLSLFVIMLSGCGGYRTPVNTDYNWSAANHKEFKGLVAITLTADDESYEPWCSGVAVSNSVIITAAHCLDEPSTWMVRVTHDCDNVRDKSCKHSRAMFRTINPNYDQKKTSEGIWNDIGLIVLRESIDIDPAVLSSTIATKTELKTAGFGRRHGRSGLLYSGTTKVKDHNLYEFQTYANGENGTCGGDSGGPAYDDDGTVVGILSRAYRGNGQDCGGFSYYTIPKMYTPWINQIISGVMPAE